MSIVNTYPWVATIFFCLVFWQMLILSPRLSAIPWDFARILQMRECISMMLMSFYFPPDVSSNGSLRLVEILL